jgi:bile acid:Na+ symporter, BASS family
VEDVPAYVKNLSFLFIVIYMISVMLETTSGEVIATLKDFGMTGRALLANVVLVPIIGLVLANLFDLRPEVRLGFLLLALAPGGPFALQFARVSKGNRVLAVTLLILLSLVAVLFTPALVELLFPPGTGRLPFARLLTLLLLWIVAPLFVGRALQRLMPEVAPKLGRILGVVSIVIFIILALTTGKYKTPAIKSMGVDGIVAIIALTLGSWVIGWLLGGPEIRNRKVFAISTSMRNVGVCFPIAVNYFPGTEVVAPILAFSGISIPMNMLFALITGRTLRDTEVRTRPVEA